MNHPTPQNIDGNSLHDGATPTPDISTDISDALHMSEAALQAIGTISPLGIFVLDLEGRTTFCNEAVLIMLDQSAAVASEKWEEAIHPDDRERVSREWYHSIQSGQTYRSSHRFVKHNGDVVYANVVATPIMDRHGRMNGFVGTIEDTTAQVEAEQARRITERQYQQMIDTAREGVWLRDAQARTIFVNRRMEEILGYTMEEMLGRPVEDFMDPSHREDAERRFARRMQGKSQQHDVVYKHKNGSDVWAIVSGSPIFDANGAFAGAFGMVTDISERKRQEATVRWQAYHDALTGLPNRTLFEDRLNQLLVMSDRQDPHIAVLFIDVDRFKQVNDSLGHDIGDQLIKVAAERIAACLRTEDTVARMGGDEFTVLLPGVEHADDAVKVAQKLLVTLAQPVEIAGHELFISSSIGVGMHPSDGKNVHSLLKHADMAMNRAKEQGGNAVCLFSKSMNTNALENLMLESSLRKALTREEFHLVYQPLVTVGMDEVLAVEALCRWTHLDMGSISPAQFIPLAEATGMIVPLGEWVLREACREAASWCECGRPIRVCVNISARQLSQAGFVGLVQSVLDESGLSSRWLELEVTESAIMKNPQAAVEVLRGLRDLGVRLSLDDFGTGYSSLSYLRQFSFDVLKIDRSFIASIVEDEVNQALVRAIIDLSHALNLEVVAEGVERDDQRDELRSLGCQAIQGYLFSPPVSPDRIAALRDGVRMGVQGIEP